MVLKKCHFEDLFKKTLDLFEREFDIEFEKGLPTSLEGMDSLQVRYALQRSTLQICDSIWDREHEPENHLKNLYERLIYEHVIFLLYLHKESMEEKT